MATKLTTAPRFDREFKHLLRKYRHLRTEVGEFARQLQTDERPGDKIPNVGYDVYKVRLANPSAGRGKQGGFRVVYYVKLADHVVLLTIYSKTEQSDIPAQAIKALIDELTGPQTGESDE